MRGRLREFLFFVIPVPADVTVSAVEGVRVSMSAHQCLTENQRRRDGEEPPAETASLVSGHSLDVTHNT